MKISKNIKHYKDKITELADKLLEKEKGITIEND